VNANAMQETKRSDRIDKEAGQFQVQWIADPWRSPLQQPDEAKLAFTVGIVIPASKSKKKVVLK